jgi:hypothetical protein
MKATFTLIAVTFMMMSITSCSGSDNEMTDNAYDQSEASVSLNTLKSLYGIEVTSASTEMNDVPVVTLNKMKTILEALRQNSSSVKDCVVTTTNNNKKVTMTENYITESRSGSTENFALNVEMNFSNDNGTIYYWGTDYKYSTDYFKWSTNSMSLSPSKTSNGYVYDFSSDGYLYFKVSDESNAIMRVPVVFKGSHNFNTDKGTYSFQLVKCSK